MSNLLEATLADLPSCVTRALQEDIGSGDITAMLIPQQQQAKGEVLCREHAVICGCAWVDEVFRQLDPNTTINWLVQDGDQVVPDQVLFTLSGNARVLLTGERSALNFLQLLSGTATLARQYAELTTGSDVRILDTRKTIPGLRVAQKYAVTVGGGYNHRIGLFDAYLIKENHILACGGIEAAVSAARKNNPGKGVEVEVQNLDELKLALAASVDVIMLDNFPLELMVDAVAINKGKCKLEASGNIDRDTLVKMAETGVDFISIGALTKHCFAVDLSLLFDDPA